MFFLGGMLEGIGEGGGANVERATLKIQFSLTWFKDTKSESFWLRFSTEWRSTFLEPTGKNCFLRQNFLHDLPVGIGEAEVSSLEAVGELFETAQKQGPEN